MDQTYYSSSVACKRLGICSKTLRRWADTGKINHIKTEGGWRKYAVDEYMRANNLNERKKYVIAEYHLTNKKMI